MVHLIFNLDIHKTLTAHHKLEYIWTLVPGLILVLIAAPSLTLLFIMEDSANAFLVVKAIGRQWYWVYNWVDTGEWREEKHTESRFLIPAERGTKDLFRLLDTTFPLYLPLGIAVRVFVTSGDVLHAWTVPSLGVKADACPGRLNEVVVLASRPGVFFGQCSEICGANHRFIPIQVIVWDWTKLGRRYWYEINLMHGCVLIRGDGKPFVIKVPKVSYAHLPRFDPTEYLEELARVKAAAEAKKKAIADAELYRKTMVEKVNHFWKEQADGISL